MISIRRCTIRELEATPNLAAVLAEYARESRMAELGEPRAQVETYRHLEATGMFHPIGAFDGDRLAGFILPIVIVLPHYGVVAATIESIFVPATERKKGIGLRLLDAARTLARELGSKGMLVSAPAGGRLDKVLSRSKRFRHSNNVYIEALA